MTPISVVHASNKAADPRKTVIFHLSARSDESFHDGHVDVVLRMAGQRVPQHPVRVDVVRRRGGNLWGLRAVARADST